MLSKAARAALDALGTLGWTVQPAVEARPLPERIERRYPAIPSPVRSFLENIEQCTRGDEKAWFLTPADYASTDRSGFAGDGFEDIERDGADADVAAESRAFWDRHLPICYSVEGDYTYLAVCVDRASADYGAVVRGYAPDFRETTSICRTFDELLELVTGMRHGSGDGELVDLLLHPHDPRRLKSAEPAGGLLAGLIERVRALPLFERYRVEVVVEQPFSRPLWRYENWSRIMPPLSAVVAGMDAEAVIRPRQAGDHDNWLRFGRLSWSDQSNRTWTTRYLEDPALAGTVRFVATEIWAPSRAVSFEAKRGPELFCLLDRNEAADSQGFVLAIRKDVLRRVDVAADETMFSVREFFQQSACVTFDRHWGEHGRFGSTVVMSGLDWTNSNAVLLWAKTHPKATVPSFRWRRSYGR